MNGPGQEAYTLRHANRLLTVGLGVDFPTHYLGIEKGSNLDNERYI